MDTVLQGRKLSMCAPASAGHLTSRVQSVGVVCQSFKLLEVLTFVADVFSVAGTDLKFMRGPLESSLVS